MSKTRRAKRVHRISLPTPFAVGPVNVYLVKDDPLVLVDTGPNTSEAYERLVDRLGRLGVALRDLDLILITHGHLDHIGLLGRVLERCGAQAYAHPHVAARASRYEDEADSTRQFHVNIMREFGVPEETIMLSLANYGVYRSYGAPAQIAHTADDGAQVHEYVAWHVPGHSPSDTLFQAPEHGFTFTGDHVLQRINPNPILRKPLPGQPRPRSLVEYRASLERSRALELGHCYPGHGAPFANHRSVIDRLIARQDARSEQILGFLADGPLTPYEVCSRLFPKLEPASLFLGLSVAAGHLELLEEQGAAAGEARNSVMYYHRAQVHLAEA